MSARDMREACARAALVDRGPYGEPPPEWHEQVARVGSAEAVRIAVKMTREEIAAAIRALPLAPAPIATADDDAVIRASGRNCEVCGKYMGAYRDDDGAAPDLCEACAEVPADDGERTALSLLADARKCVALVNVNGYYDVWLARCDRVLANAKRPADDARPMVTGGGLIKFVRDETKGGPRG